MCGIECIVKSAHGKEQSIRVRVEPNIFYIVSALLLRPTNIPTPEMIPSQDEKLGSL